eukprot:TRINITY_DN9521_c0_g1_i1.p1 TRINITY_DN9521_c0_g1~~TRINITY_DN9521_c0_g1_i1.p1  ORF type:complete len:634 (+),score=135.06 TRINITY_DN9521_c0_g1_i1:94-1902(+)
MARGRSSRRSDGRRFGGALAAPVAAAAVALLGRTASASSASAAVAAAPPPDRFEVTALPGYEDESGKPKALPSRMWTGYIDAGTPPSGKGTMYFHYWMVQAEQHPETAPVLIWYNGGPGASSLFGIFQEFGPLLLTEESFDSNFLETGLPSPILNPSRWSQTHTLVAIDSPPPMGLSFCSEEGPSGGPTSCGPWTDKSVFRANHAAHKKFFNDIFPGLKGNPIFFAGESYGGMYVPGFVGALLDDPIEGLNFQGMLVGDGWPGCKPLEGHPVNWCLNLDNVGVFKYPNANPGPWYDIEFFHGHQQFSNDLHNEILKSCPENMLKGLSGEKLSAVCEGLIERMAEEVGPFSAYNLYDNCPEDNPWTPPGDWSRGDKHGMFRRLAARRLSGNETDLRKQLEDAKKKIAELEKKLRERKQSGESGTSSPCLGDAMPIWFSKNVSLKAIGAPDNIRFINLDNGHGFNYTSDQAFVGPIYERLIQGGYKVLVYEGDTDACGLTSSPNEDIFFPLFGEHLNKTRNWRPWSVGEGFTTYLGGYITEWGKSSGEDGPQHPSKVMFVSVRGAGHMVPLNRPRSAYTMVSHFTYGQEFPDYKPPGKDAAMYI